MRKTIIDLNTGVVTNVIEMEDGANWSPPEGQIIGTDGGEIGQMWNGTEYIDVTVSN